MTTNKNHELSLEGIEQMPLQDFAQDAYLNYSMSVIRDRALPSVKDGMKPVQRRIIYAMSRLGITAKSKHVKSARTVGEVLGKFHPHGDSACYEAMVLMAQPFTYRYPLIDGQGNWGDVEDPKSFAAMRYTEARLSPYSELLLSELNQGCVEWTPNFDGTVDEPLALPARVPSILLNGTMGIAVGMATDIPPHNLKELVKASTHLIDHPDATVADLMKYIQAPDYPCGAEIITPRSELLKIYETGRGTVRCRAVYKETREGIEITALPYQVSTGQIEKELAGLMAKKKLPWISDLINASDHTNPCRFIIVPRRNNKMSSDEIMSHLFATTALECTYRVNLNILGLDGKPQVKDLRTILSEWLCYRRETVTRRFTSRLEAINKRLHLLDGLLKIFADLDEVIHIIRCENHPNTVLKKRYDLTDTQVEYILDTKLRQLARLEEEKIDKEQKKLADEKSKLETLLTEKDKLNAFIKKELNADAHKYGDDRRCAVIERESAHELDITAAGPSQNMTVILSKMGWIRAATGTTIDPLSLSYKSGDEFLSQVQARSNQYVQFLTNLGRSFSLPISSLPSARGQGEPLSTKFTMLPNESILYMLSSDIEDYYLLSTSHCYGFLCLFSDMLTRNRAGKALVSLENNARLLPPIRVHDINKDIVVLVTSQGRLCIYPITDMRVFKRGKGIKMSKIHSHLLDSGVDGLIDVVCLQEGEGVILHAGEHTLTLSAEEIQQRLGSRENKGEILPDNLQRLDSLEIIPAPIVEESPLKPEEQGENSIENLEIVKADDPLIKDLEAYLSEETEETGSAGSADTELDSLNSDIDAILRPLQPKDE